MSGSERSLARLRADFSEPGPRFRSTPFWGWNDRLSIEEIERQAADLKEKGFGGFFIHSREGLETPYLGPEWMDCVRSAAAKARELGLDMWIYDEDCWPSGFAGGRVPALGDECRAKGLSIMVGAAVVPPEASAAYAALPEGEDRLKSFHRLSPAEAAPALGPGEILLVLREEISSPSPWFNGQSPPDTLNPACVDAFIRSTHEEYRRALGEDFGSLVMGFFYDEPNAHDRHAAMTGGRGWLPWTASFPEFFLERRGYDFFDSAPLLFFDGEGERAARHDFWRTLSERFTETFTKRIGDWCRDRGLASSGHFLWEGSLGVATRVCGAIMPNYAHQDLPGIDILGLSDEEVLTVKQCSSVANQLGKERLVSEIYGCAGWDLSYADQKRQGDWQFALGVTMRCQHNVLYSIRGCRKRDYPPSFNYHAAWWDGLKAVEDYFARVSAVLSGGYAVREVLVVHPASTAWSRLGTDPRGFAKRGLDRDIPGINEYGERLNGLLRLLVGEHYDCDLGDEAIMAQEGRVVAGPDVTELRIGRGRYRAVILPSLDTLLGSTLELLRSFAEAGGRIIVVEPSPTMREGRPSAACAEFFHRWDIVKVGDDESLVAALETFLSRPVSAALDCGRQARDIWCILKNHGDANVIFASNRDRLRPAELVLEVACPGTVEEWDLYTGEARRVESVEEECILRFSAYFPPSASRLFVIDRSGRAARLQGAAKDEGKGFARRGHWASGSPEEGQSSETILGPRALVARSMPNALVLDRAAFRIARGSWSEETELLSAQDSVRAALGMRPFEGNEGIHRYFWADEASQRDGVEVDFRFRFELLENLDDPIFFMLEAFEDARALFLNGEEATLAPQGHFLDLAFRTIALPPPQAGENEILLRYAYRNRSEVEECALLGNFAVDKERRIRRESGFADLGDWCLQGYPNYPGSLVYRFDVLLDPSPRSRYALELGRFSAAAVYLRVNGKKVDFPPWEGISPIGIGEYIIKGMNLIEIELVGSPRNFLGPLHRAIAEGSAVDRSSFLPAAADFRREYVLRPYGLFGPLLLRHIREGRPEAKPETSP